MTWFLGPIGASQQMGGGGWVRINQGLYLPGSLAS